MDDIQEAQMRGERVPPHSTELEQQVLGAMLLSKQAITRVDAILDETDFFRSRHLLIYRAICKMYGETRPVDLPLLADELERMGVLEECGGTSYLANVAACVGTWVNAEHHAKLVFEKAVRRKASASADQLIANNYDHTRDVFDDLYAFEQELSRIVENRTVRDYKPVGVEVDEAYTLIEQEASGKIIGLPTGFHNVDRIIGGFRPGQLIVVAARPGHGKTSWGMNVAANIAIRQNIPVGVFSLEMSRLELVQRLIKSEARITVKDRKGYYPPTEAGWRKLAHAATMVREAPIFIDDTGGQKPLHIRTSAARMVRERGVQIIIVDYLQLIRSVSNLQNNALEIGEITKALKTAAKDLGIPILLNSQLNREIEKRTDPRPMLSDLRGSGSIEEDADIVMFPFRPAAFEPEGTPRWKQYKEEGKLNEAMLRTEKHRGGDIGDAPMIWHAGYTRFDDEAPEYDANITVPHSPAEPKSADRDEAPWLD